MSVSAVGSNAQNPLTRILTGLEKNGLSSDSASSVASEIDSVVKSVMSQSGSSGPADPTTVRQAIDAKIKSDVESGTLTQEQADAVTKTLDQLDQQMSKAGGPPPGGGQPPAGGPPPGGGGGSADSSSESSSASSTTVVSVTTSTASDGTVTTVTTYADGSKSTTTSKGSADSAAQALQTLLKASTESGALSQSTADYMKSLLGSGLIDVQA